MIISHGRTFIFVHIPKTGGTSLALALEDRAMKDDILIGDTPKAQRRKGRLVGVETAGRLWKHSTLADVRGLITHHDMQSYFVFTLVRNPWDRLVSLYHWLQVQRFDHPMVSLAQSTDFSAFLNDRGTQENLLANPYGHYVSDGLGQSHAALFARIEHVQEDLAPFWAHVGFDLALPHVNRSRREADYRRFYSDADAELVEDLFGADIARSGYSFHPDR